MCIRDRNLAHIRTLAAMASDRGQTLSQMALAWALRDRRVTSVLIGASSVAQLDENLDALGNLEFTVDELARIDLHAVEGHVDLWRDVAED